MGGQYELDFARSQQLEEALKLVPNRSERLVNEVIHVKGTKMMIAAIVGLMPVSDRNKKHAKFSNPLKSDTFNLGFRVYARGGAANKPGSFGYLVFPDEGRGSSNPLAQEFFKGGADFVSDHILMDVMRALEEAHNKLI